MKAFQSVDCGDNAGDKPVAHTDCKVDVCGRSSTRACEEGCDDCAEILHGFNNALASMLLNAQVMEWKLPSYSRSKRYLHEIERNAQRGGELVNRLLGRLEVRCRKEQTDCRTCAESRVSAGADHTVGTQLPVALAPEAELPRATPAHPAPVFLTHGKAVPHTMV